MMAAGSASFGAPHASCTGAFIAVALSKQQCQPSQMRGRGRPRPMLGCRAEHVHVEAVGSTTKAYFSELCM